MISGSVYEGGTCRIATVDYPTILVIRKIWDKGLIRLIM
jgi:hypothetical protein